MANQRENVFDVCTPGCKTQLISVDFWTDSHLFFLKMLFVYVCSEGSILKVFIIISLSVVRSKTEDRQRFCHQLGHLLMMNHCICAVRSMQTENSSMCVFLSYSFFLLHLLRHQAYKLLKQEKAVKQCPIFYIPVKI